MRSPPGSGRLPQHSSVTQTTGAVQAAMPPALNRGQHRFRESKISANRSLQSGTHRRTFVIAAMPSSHYFAAVILAFSPAIMSSAFAQERSAATNATPSTAQQESDKPTEQVTGSGGHHLRYSSTQVDVGLTDAQQQTFRQARDHRYAGKSIDAVLAAIAAALKQQGYAQISVDNEFHLVEARHDETLIGRSREILRGVMKTRMPLPARPDHQSTEALIAVAADTGGQATTVRSRFRTTVWDSNGDSKTSVASESTVYRNFFASVGKQLDQPVAATAGR